MFFDFKGCKLTTGAGQGLQQEQSNAMLAGECTVESPGAQVHGYRHCCLVATGLEWPKGAAWVLEDFGSSVMGLGLRQAHFESYLYPVDPSTPPVETQPCCNLG